MSNEAFRKLEEFRKNKNWSISQLCAKMKVQRNYYYRWKQKGIKGAYMIITEDFIHRERQSSGTESIND